MEISKDKNLIIQSEFIERRIFIIRGRKVMIDDDLAELYQIPTKRLNQAVKRNSSRFPEDFMFQLTREESQNLRSQFVTSSLNYGGHRYLSYAFTEQGVAMLSSVLHSGRAVAVNIAIIGVRPPPAIAREQQRAGGKGGGDGKEIR